MKDFDKIFRGKPSRRSKDRKRASDETSENVANSALRVQLQVSGEFWIEIASAAWKLRQKITDPVTREPKDDMRPLMRHVEAIWDSLSSIGLEIQDHTNQPFDSGQSLEVLAFQPTPDISKEIVSETVKPSIYLKGHRLQMGQVIVATPQETQSG